MARSGKRQREGFLSGYKLDEYMLAPDPSAGRAGIRGGTSPEGLPVIIKSWRRRKGVADLELEEIWRHELRQLHRLAGFPTASDFIARLQQAGYDESGFYLVLDPGQRRPLQVLLDDASTGHWLKQPRAATNRVRIWRNLARASQGLETLHAQGLLHRNIDEWAVLTAGSDQPDFQLTGFEWSMRLTSNQTAKVKVRGRSSDQHYSFQHDWLLLGLLAARLLSVNVNRLVDLRVAPSEIAEHINNSEAKLLRAIVHNDAGGRLSGDVVAQRIAEVLRSLDAEIAAIDPKFHLALRLGPGTPLAGRIRQASDDEIEMDDVEAQLQFVRNDLAADAPLLMALKRGASDTPRLVLRGKHLLYQVHQYVHQRGKSAPTWEFAYCDSVEPNGPAPVNILRQLPLDAKSLECMWMQVALEQFPAMRGKLSSWEQLQQQLVDTIVEPSREEIVHRALTLTQFLEALYAAADVFPVEIVQEPASLLQNEESATLRLRARVDPDRAALSDALNLKPPAVRLESALLGEIGKSEGWILTSSKSLGERSPSDTEWRFQQPDRSAGGPTSYIFTGSNFVPHISEAFLIPAGSVGQDVQFRRRLKALRALKDHRELLAMLADPRGRILDSHDELNVDDAFNELDGPKQQALRQLVSTMPLYLVQGPPGVGKTRLVRDLVRRRFKEESTTRILLTAQSNAAVDHLLSELESLLEHKLESNPLVVRCRSKEAIEAGSQFEISFQSTQIVTQLVDSPLAKSAPPHLHRRLGQLAAALNIEALSAMSGTGRVGSVQTGHLVRSFESLVVRAANVVFATTNSLELERLIDEKGQFDWAIVEEAGKATGGELLSPLLLSHRRLMIGDHKQLPPFGSDQMKDLLAVPEGVRDAINAGEEFIGRALRDPTTDEILDDVEEDVENFPALCSEALRDLTLFEGIIEKEFARQERSRGGRPIATKLTAQHRMHPLIAELVSRCFYNGEIKTNEAKAEAFRTGVPPFDSLDKSRLPISPIVFVDMPYLQDTIGLLEGDRLPRWHNPNEVSATVELLSLLTPRKNAKEKYEPSVAVLSPYAQQVSRLNDAIDAEWSSRLSQVHAFKLPRKLGGICGTVDSFQGNEADIVIVSLVRNNQHGSPLSALGFLSDFRRMNVLLSRARWQLVLVGSKNFLEAIVRAARGTEHERELTFLATMLKLLTEWEASGLAQRVPYAKLMGTGS